MTVAQDLTHRGSAHTINAVALEDRFEVLKEIGDGSFGSVVLARVRSAGATVARRGTVVSGCLQSVAWVLANQQPWSDCNQDDEKDLRVISAVLGT